MISVPGAFFVKTVSGISYYVFNKSPQFEQTETTVLRSMMLKLTYRAQEKSRCHNRCLCDT